MVHYCDGLVTAGKVGHLSCVQHLVWSGVDINNTNIMGLTCLHQACFNNHLKIIQFLLDNGAELYMRDIFGRYPIDVCRSKEAKELVKSRM